MTNDSDAIEGRPKGKVVKCGADVRGSAVVNAQSGDACDGSGVVTVKELDVGFKLHAPQKTTISGRLVNGELLDLKVTPESRRADVINMLQVTD